MFSTHCASFRLRLRSSETFADRAEDGRNVTPGLRLQSSEPYRSLPQNVNVFDWTRRRLSDSRYAQLLIRGVRYPPGPPRVSRSSNPWALTLKPLPNAQLLVSVQCALMLPPENRRSPSKFQPAH